MQELKSKQSCEDFLNKHDVFLFDCDGVLWRGSTLLPHTTDTIKLLRQREKQLIFVTNNSTKSREAYTNKFKKLGIDVKKEEIFCSSYSSAVYLKQVVKFPADKKVLIIGEKGLEEELTEAGIKWVGGTDPELRKDWDDEAAASTTRDKDVGCVLAGLDTHLNYRKLALAQQQLADKNCMFLATNIDSTYPSAGHLLPGAGTVIRAIATCSGREPEAALGKPSQAMMDCIEARFKFDPSRAVMVGDRLNTDMKFGKRGGLTTLFVLTGVDSLPEHVDATTHTDVDFYAQKLGVLYEQLGVCN